MAYTINTLALTSALVALPLTGAWHADVALSPVQGDAGAELAGTVTIDLDGLALVGTVVRSDVVDGQIGARIVGGAGGLSNVLAERFYKGGVQVRKIVADITREAGETLSPLSSAAILDQIMPTWQRAREPAGEALRRIVSAVGGSWRVSTAGAVLVVGAESWPPVTPQHTLVPGSDPASGTQRIAWPERTPPELVPGVTFRGVRVRYVVHELSATGLRTEIREREPRDFLERLRGYCARDAWYSRLWPGVVDRQNADGSVDVVIAGRFGETQVQLRHGIPGVSVLVAQGQQVLVGYEQDDPKRPFAALWTSSGTAEIGTLLVTVTGPSAPIPGTVASVELFEPTPTGDALLAAALAVISASAGFLAAKPALGLPITMGTVRVS